MEAAGGGPRGERGQSGGHREGRGEKTQVARGAGRVRKPAWWVTGSSADAPGWPLDAAGPSPLGTPVKRGSGAGWERVTPFSGSPGLYSPADPCPAAPPSIQHILTHCEGACPMARGLGPGTGQGGGGPCGVQWSRPDIWLQVQGLWNEPGGLVSRIGIWNLGPSWGRGR